MKNHNQFVRCLENIQDLTAQKQYNYAMILNGGLYSLKTIRYIKKTGKYSITNHIDDSKQSLTGGQMMNVSLTHIGQAMSKRALIALID